MNTLIFARLNDLTSDPRIPVKMEHSLYSEYGDPSNIRRYSFSRGAWVEDASKRVGIGCQGYIERVLAYSSQDAVDSG